MYKFVIIKTFIFTFCFFLSNKASLLLFLNKIIKFLIAFDINLLIFLTMIDFRIL